MLKKRVISSASALAIASGMLTAVAAEPVINASADFETDLGSFNIESSHASSPLELSSRYPGWLEVGNGYGSVYVPDEQLAQENNKVTVSFEVAYGKLSGKYFYHSIADSKGTELVNWTYRAYDGNVAKNILGTAENLHTAADIYSQPSEPDITKSNIFTYEFDFASKTVTLTVHNNDTNKDAVHTADLPEGVTDVKSLRIGSDYANNTKRQCVVDNISITTEEGEAGLIPYTINYTLDGEILRTKTANVRPGTVITAENVFLYNGTKYFILDETAPEMNVTEEGENVLNVPVREAQEFTVSIKAAGDLDEIIKEYSVVEGDDVSYTFPRYRMQDNTLYVTQNNDDIYYGGNIEDVTENTTVEIDYLEMYNTCVLYDELDSSTGDGANVRASNGSAFQNMPYQSSKEIEPGKYTFIIGYSSKGRGSKLMIGDTLIKEIGLGEERNSWYTSKIENVEITEGGYITLQPGGAGSRDCLDTVVAISENPLPEEPELYENRIKSIDKVEGGIRVKTSLVTQETGKLLCSMYDIDENLLAVKTADVTQNETTYTLDVSDVENIRTVKAYLWDGTETMKPIAETKDFEILLTQQPKTTPSEAQQLQIDRKYGMFIHFGINTFSPNGAEWTDGTLSPSIYTPPQINADQWIKAAKDAGMSYVILVAKHHDGFCMYDTKYTDYGVNSSPNTTDVVAEVAKACEKYGIKLGLYYSLWDRHERTYANDDRYAEYMKNQITELLDGRYGEIVEFWLDGGWDKTNERWHMDELYDLVKRLQPNCVFGVNHTIGPYNSAGFAPEEYHPQNYKENMPMKYFPSDFRLLDPKYTKVGADADPKLYEHDGKQYYLPFEATICVKQKGKWFWSENYPQLLNITPQHIAQKYKDFTEQKNVLIINCAPNRNGELEQYDIDTIKTAGEIIGISEKQTDIYEFENSNYTEGEDTGSLAVSTAVADYSGTGFLGGWTSSCSAEFTVNSETERTAKLALVYGNGNGETTANISVNGENAAELKIYNTSSWAFVTTEFVEVPLKAGENKIVITTGPESKGPNLDCMYLR